MSTSMNMAKIYKENIFDEDEQSMKKEYRPVMKCIITSEKTEFTREELSKMTHGNIDEILEKLCWCNFIEYNGMKNIYEQKYITGRIKKKLQDVNDTYLTHLLISASSNNNKKIYQD